MPLRPNDQLLDLCFLIDSTGSMKPYIREAADKINYIDDQIRKNANLADAKALQVAVVAYRDYNPQDFKEFISKDITKGFTSDINKVKSSLTELRAFGGGDGAEAVGTALSTAINLKWRLQATKIIILITDAPPHGYLGAKPSATDEAPALEGKLDIMTMKQSMETKYTDLRIFVVKCGDMRKEYPGAELFYEQILTRKTLKDGRILVNGTTVILTDAGLLANAVIGLALENQSLRKVINDLQSKSSKPAPAAKLSISESLHENLLLIAGPTGMRKGDSAKIDDAKEQVKKLLAGTEFPSVQTNVYVDSLAPEEEHNVGIWRNARSIYDIHGIKPYERPAIDIPQTLRYEHGPINNDQILSLASMYTEAHDEDGSPDKEEDDACDDDGDDTRDEEDETRDKDDGEADGYADEE